MINLAPITYWMFPLRVVIAMLFPLVCSAVGEDRVTVAVLPFSASIDSKELEGLDRALSEMLITDLTAVRSIKLVERSRLNEVLNEIQLGKEGFVDPSTAATIGKGVGAKAILTGSFFAKGDKLRIDARLIHVESGTVLVAEEITGSSADPFELEKKLQQKLIDAMGVRLSALEKAEIATKPDADVEAAAAYGRAQALNDAGDRDAAKTEAEKALRMAPNFKQVKTLLESFEERVSRMEEDVGAVKEVQIKRIRQSGDDSFIGKFLDADDLDIRFEAIVAIRSEEEKLTRDALVLAEQLRSEALNGDLERFNKLTLVNLAIVAKVSDQHTLATLVKKHTNPFIKAMALAKIRDDFQLVELFAAGLGSVDLRSYSTFTVAGEFISIPLFWDVIVTAARNRISNPDSILKLGKAGRAEFVARITDTSKFQELAGNGDVSPEVRREAQRLLPSASLEKFVMSESGDHAIALINRISDPTAIANIALAHPDPAVSLKATKRVEDEQVLMQIAESNSAESNALLAVSQMKSEAFLDNLVATADSAEIREAAKKKRDILRMSDETKLQAIAENGFNEHFQNGIIQTVEDQDVLKKLVNAPRTYRVMHAALLAAIDRLNDVSFLRELTLNASDIDLRRHIFERIIQLPQVDGHDEFMVRIATDRDLKWSSSGLAEPGDSVRRQAFMRINDVRMVRSVNVYSSDDDVQKRMAESLGDSYVDEAITIAIQQKRFVPPSLIKACNNQQLLREYFECCYTWEISSWGNPRAALAERAIHERIQDPFLLVRSALDNTDPACRDISLEKISDKALLKKIAQESRFFDTQHMAREKLAQLP